MFDLSLLISSSGKFTIKNVVPTQEGEASKVKVKVRVNIHGIFYIKSAMLVEKTQNDEAMETDSVPNEVQLPDVEMMSGGKSGTDEKKPEEGVGSNTGQEGENVEGTNETEETNAGSSKNDSPDIEKKMASRFLECDIIKLKVPDYKDRDILKHVNIIYFHCYN